MKAILRVKEVVEYERIYEVECNDDIENREDLRMLMTDINEMLAEEIKEGQMAYGEDSEANVFCDAFKDWKNGVGASGKVISDEITTYIVIPDNVTLVKKGEGKCEI